jgi:release factor glutamine methyltransferase
MLQINDWLLSATKALRASGIDSASLDSELILAHVLDNDRAYLKAHDDQVLSKSQTHMANQMLEKRQKRLPIAYLTGYKYFYGRKFFVTEETLIPRPESEDIIESLKSYIENTIIPHPQLLDVGTGSGCLGITCKLELTHINVTLSDVSIGALGVARDNAKNLNADVAILESDLLENITISPNIILANLPYVDESWEKSPETKYEPSTALVAKDSGMAITKKLISQAARIQKQADIIIFESDPVQHQELIDFALKNGYELVAIMNYTVTIARL